MYTDGVYLCIYIYIFILTHVCNIGSATPTCIVASLLFQSTPLGKILNQSGQTIIRAIRAVALENGPLGPGVAPPTNNTNCVEFTMNAGVFTMN